MHDVQGTTTARLQAQPVLLGPSACERNLRPETRPQSHEHPEKHGICLARCSSRWLHVNHAGEAAVPHRERLPADPTQPANTWSMHTATKTKPAKTSTRKPLTAATKPATSRTAKGEKLRKDVIAEIGKHIHAFSCGGAASAETMTLRSRSRWPRFSVECRVPQCRTSTGLQRRTVGS